MPEHGHKEERFSRWQTWHSPQLPNSHGTLAFSLSSSITFLRASGPGDTLYAEARERYIGRSTGFYQVDVTNQNGDLIATFESSVFRKDQKVPFTL
jgi:acyl-CoA thioesterase